MRGTQKIPFSTDSFIFHLLFNCKYRKTVIFY